MSKINLKNFMEVLSHENRTFENISYTGKEVKNREFEACTFIKSDLSNSDFSYTNFIDCKFIDCNLSMMKVNSSSFRNISFDRCKLLGVNFSDCNDFLFSVGFKDCILDYASFSNKKMIKTKFLNTSLKEVSFLNTNLTGSLFEDTNLDRAVFSNCILKEANFLTATNYAIDPELNKLEKAKFSLSGSVGLLSKYKIIIE